ncbi:hypothetical protein ACHAXR_009196 [Thalassiosira sp. AJA248-18]
MKMKGAKQKKEIKKSFVDHTYTNYSQARISDLVDAYDGTKEQLFPSKLHKILSTHEYAHIISWRPHGRAWAVENKSLFCSVILPKHFNHNEFDSFNRSVNGWGFKVCRESNISKCFTSIVVPLSEPDAINYIYVIQRLLRDGPDKNSYYHELFLRNRPELTYAMTRLIRPGKRLPNIACEPDFYGISRNYPLPAPATAPSEVEEANTSGKRAPSEIEEANTCGKRAPSPIFTPSGTKCAKEGYQHSHQVQGIYPPYGYSRPHDVTMPFAQITHSTQPRGYSQEPPPYSRPPPYSELPPNSGPPQRTPSPIFTPPATKRAKAKEPQHSPRVQGVYPPHGYGHPYNVTMPYTQIPPSSQPRGYPQEPPPYSRPPPYSEPLPDYGPLPGGVYHALPGQFYHEQSQTPAAPRGDPNIQFHHQNLGGPVSMPPHEWHSSMPYHYYCHPPAHGTAQHDEKYRPESMMPILYTNNQSDHSNCGYATHIGHIIAERNQNHGIDERKSVEQEFYKPDSDHTPGVLNPNLKGSSQFSEGLEPPRSTAINSTLQHTKEEPYRDEASTMAPAPEHFSVNDPSHPLGIDNFSDSPHEKPTAEKNQ